MDQRALEAYSIKGFCETHSISRAQLYKLLKEGRGPRIAHIGRKVLITREAAAEWRRNIEGGAA